MQQRYSQSGSPWWTRRDGMAWSNGTSSSEANYRLDNEWCAVVPFTQMDRMTNSKKCVSSNGKKMFLQGITRFLSFLVFHFGSWFSLVFNAIAARISLARTVHVLPHAEEGKTLVVVHVVRCNDDGSKKI